MRKQTPLDSLITRTVQAILAATLLEPDRWWYLSDLAKRIKRTPSSLQGPLDSLVGAGILNRRKEGNRVYFSPNRNCPFLPELQGLIAKTVGLVDVIREVLRPVLQEIEIAFVYGSFARSEERAESDLDLMVVTKLGLAKLSPLLDCLEMRIGRPVNMALYTNQELKQKSQAKNHFVTAVLEKDKLFVVGRADDLERLIGGRPAGKTRNKQTRAR